MPTSSPSHRHALVLLALSVATVATGFATERGRPLRVLSYNIHHGEGVDGRLDLARIAKVITDARADIVALQEVDQRTARAGGIDQAAELGKLTGLHATYGKALDYEGGGYGQALLSRWALEDFCVMRLPNSSNREPRIAVTAVVRPTNAPAFRFVGTHLDATRDDDLRWLQAGALIERFARETLPVVLAGDFNARPETRMMKRFFEQWSDASAAAPAFTIPATKPTGRIDYVLLRPATPWQVVSTTVLAEAVASDHRPLLVELAPVVR